MPTGFIRYQNYEKMPQDGSHLRAKLSGITNNELEWSLAGYAELYDTSLGHIGHTWEREEFDLDFRANKPLGDKNHIAFGVGVKHTSLDVKEVVTSPWNFPVIDTFPGTPNPITGIPVSNIPIIDYHYQSNPTKFDRFTGFIQNSSDLNDRLSLSLGVKFEDSDLSGSSLQPGARMSYLLDEGNILWGAYSRAYRQASLVEQYTKVSYARVYDPATGVWINQSFAGDPSLDDEKMDAYELGWRTRPSDKLLIELSLYHYETKDAVFSGPSGLHYK
jgi:outer membrane receptor protein involved in Fe transport